MHGLSVSHKNNQKNVERQTKNGDPSFDGSSVLICCCGVTSLNPIPGFQAKETLK